MQHITRIFTIAVMLYAAVSMVWYFIARLTHGRHAIDRVPMAIVVGDFLGSLIGLGWVVVVIVRGHLR